METIIIELDENNIDSEKLEIACKTLRDGELVAFPTETVYGLGGDALNETAAKRIYAAKGRPSDNPLIVHVAETEDVNKIASEVPEMAKKLMDKYWPGPLTMVFKKKDIVPDGTTGGLDTVGVRMPSNKIARELIRQSGILIAAPSANVSGRPSPTKGEHVIFDMEGKIPVIIDGGDVGIGLESTIVDVTGDIPTILRPGYITKEMIKNTCGDVSIDPAILEKPDKNLIPKAPGMKYKHYAPKADFFLYSGNGENVINAIVKESKESILQGKTVAIVATDEDMDEYQEKLKNERYSNRFFVLSIGSRENEESIAHNLFAVLRKCDELGADVILGETYSDEGLGMAIMNRLVKACGYSICEV